MDYILGIFRLYSDFTPLIFRVVLGLAFVAHGYPKLFTSREQVAQWFESIGIKPGKFWVLVVGVVEFFGGIALILGAWVELVGILLAVNMVVAMWKVKWGKVGYVAQGGWELDLIYLVVALSFLFTGAGAFSLSAFGF
ncbi:MAG: DoxX family protein [bacterium]|nr:DoxX family protein [bacterium]